MKSSERGCSPPDIVNVTATGIEDVRQSEKLSLIPGLPDDIALCCLARVPRRYHSVLNCVSRRWRELVCGEELRLYRQKHHLDETWVYALCRDKLEQLSVYVLDPDQLRRGWKPICGIPDRCLKRKGVGFEVLGKKIYLFGGCGWVEDATDEVFSYDASANVWTRAGSLSTARCFFAHESLDGKIYAIGGLGSESTNLHSWDIYDSHTSRWSSHIDPNVIPDAEDSFVMDGKIYIRCSNSSASSHMYAIIYNPSDGTWQRADTDLANGWHSPAVVIEGVLYVLDQTSGLRLMMWERDNREWIPVARLSQHFTTPPCRIAAVGKKILVVGRGLGTVTFNVGNGGCVEGVLVTSSVVKLSSDYEVIRCKTLSV